MITLDEFLACYRHRPGNPVLDRNAALIAVRHQGRDGHAIAAGDEATVHATGEQVTVTAVNHDTGVVAVRHGDEWKANFDGHHLLVTRPARHDPVPDNFLEGMTLAQARTAMTPNASDYGRYPKYDGTYFDGWVFGRARRAVRHRGELILVGGQRALVRVDDPDSPFYMVWITRNPGGQMRTGRAIAVDVRHVRIQPHEQS